jgi:hypothetical protein
MGVMIAIGIGVAGTLWALAWVATQTPETRTAERDGQSHAAQKHDEAGAGAVNRYPTATPYEPRCNPAYSKDDDDLCQQRRMAKAAERAANIAFWQTIVGSVGALLLFPTLWYAARSARAAADAAHAAEQSVAVAQETAQRQLRAYLNYDQATIIDFTSDRPLLQVSLKNYGHTPAYDVRFRIGIGIVPIRTRESSSPPLHDEWQQFGVVAPQAPVIMHRTLTDPDIPHATRRAITAGVAGIFVAGEVEYTDAFTQKRMTRFLTLYGGWAEIRPDGHLATCEEGNEAT